MRCKICDEQRNLYMLWRKIANVSAAEVDLLSRVVTVEVLSFVRYIYSLVHDQLPNITVQMAQYSIVINNWTHYNGYYIFTKLNTSFIHV